MRGRKPLPTELKILRGNPGHRPLPENEPTAPAGVGPAHPLFLDPIGRRFYRELAKLLGPDGTNVLTQVDRLVLEVLADAVSEFLEAKTVLREHGLTYSDKNGDPKKRPEVMIAKDSAARIRALAAEFGLTPSSRTRIPTADRAESEDIEELFG